MKYKRLFTEDGFYNEDGNAFMEEYEKYLFRFWKNICFWILIAKI
jgi:hypothetical protein